MKNYTSVDELTEDIFKELRDSGLFASHAQARRIARQKAQEAFAKGQVALEDSEEGISVTYSKD